MFWPVYHIASGQSFFSGIALILLSAFFLRSEKRMVGSLAFVVFVLGAVGVFVSSAAVPAVVYLVAVVATLLWIVAALLRKWRPAAAILMALSWLSAAAFELPYHFGRPLETPVTHRSLTIIGDSITAGFGHLEATDRWPHLLKEKHSVEIQNLSRAGATVTTASKIVDRTLIDSPVVILEIGGNDLIGFTHPSVFEKMLDGLISKVAAPDRQLLMFELPLPPFRHAYGRIQRTLARKHGVTLVPKRLFLDIIAEESATVDSIHLSAHGHRLMAEEVWRWVGPAFDPVPVN